MELEEMKNLWNEMSGEIEKQKKLTDKLIIMMTKQQYRNRLAKIRTPEIASTFVAAAFVLIILVNFDKYDTVYLMISSIVSMIILSVLPVLSLNSIRQLNNLDISGNNYKQIIEEYAKGKRKFLAVQKLSIYLGFVLMIAFLPVAIKIMGKTVQMEDHVWYWLFPFELIFFIFFSRWVYGHYVKTTIHAENLLKELED